jgi:hypothetical protein
LRSGIRSLPLLVLQSASSSSIAAVWDDSKLTQNGRGFTLMKCGSDPKFKPGND